MRWCHWYFSGKVQRKSKLWSFSAIHLLDESEMSRTREILVNSVISKMFIFWFFLKMLFNIIPGILGRGSRLDDFSRRKHGWRFTAGFEYGCAVQLVGTQKNAELFIISGAFFFELMSSFFTVSSICIFATKFNEKENQGAIRLFISSMKVKCPGPGKFWYFLWFLSFSHFP